MEKEKENRQKKNISSSSSTTTSILKYKHSFDKNSVPKYEPFSNY
jgi:hypothetical protein